MTSPIWSSYDHPAMHEVVSRIIRERSTNPVDIREVALQGLDLSRTRRILSLGCGFGFMAEALQARLPADAEMIGIDACASNAGPYLHRATAGGRTARFLRAEIANALDFPDQSFDLVICSYSLYFFPEVLPEVARVLRGTGSFVTITHSERSFAGLLRAAGIAQKRSPLTELVCAFCTENARGRLEDWFASIEQIEYPNALRFGQEHLDDLLTYIQFKIPLLDSEASLTDGIPPPILESIRTHLAEHGEVVIEKDDACFRCAGPRRVSPGSGASGP